MKCKRENVFLRLKQMGIWRPGGQINEENETSNQKRVESLIFNVRMVCSEGFCMFSDSPGGWLDMSYLFTFVKIQPYNVHLFH